MTRQFNGILKTGAILFALVLPFVLPTQALAETLTLSNTTKSTMVVQVATVVRGAVRRGAPTTLGPGEKMRVTVTGNKLINIYDARFPNRMLYQGTITGSTDDAHYVITHPDARVPKCNLEMVRGGMKR